MVLNSTGNSVGKSRNRKLKLGVVDTANISQEGYGISIKKGFTLGNFTVKQFSSSIFFLFLPTVRKVAYFKYYSEADCVASHGFFGYSEGLACCC